MTEQEERECAEEKRLVYQGILFNSGPFQLGKKDPIVYDLNCPEFAQLRDTYHLLEVAGEGTSFERARRLLHHFAPKLTHCSWFPPDRVKCNALSLLDYSYDNPKQGINCLNKSKILVECCLAVGIFARRMHIMPQSPYDMDNHVVAEIYDDARGKWVMLDPSTDGYFVEEGGTPLSLLEMRARFAENQFVTYIKSTDEPLDAKALCSRYWEENTYLCKNLFWLQVDRYNGFGEREERLNFVPEGYSVQKNRQAKWQYCITICGEEISLKAYILKQMEEEKHRTEAVCSNITLLLELPQTHDSEKE